MGTGNTPSAEEAGASVPADDAVVSTAQADDVTSDSSPGSPSGDKAETRETLLEAVQRVLPKKDDGDGPAEPGEASPASRTDQDQPPEGEITQEELDSYRPRTKRRIEELLGQNRELRTANEHLQAQASITSELQTFLKQNDIAKEDFGLTLDLAAAMRRGDFQAFLEGVMPYVQLAQEQLGIVLPQDLQVAVQQGHMSEDAARYVAQTRGQTAVFQAQTARETERRQEEARTTQIRDFTKSVETAVADWEKGVRRRDADYARKEPVVNDMLHAVVAERGPPKSPEEAVEIAKLAYDRANRMLSGFTPPRRSTPAVPSSLARVNGARAEPKSLLEAAQQALERR